MRKSRLLESLNRDLGGKVNTRRYSLSELLSESYNAMYQCEEDSNVKKLVESHLADVKSNPRDIDRLSRQLCLVKEVVKLTESGELKDEDLVDKKAYDTVEPKKDRVMIRKECNERRKPIKEADEPDLTDDELEELAKHLETIRKERKDASKTEMTESDEPEAPVRRGIKCTMSDAKKPKKEDLDESVPSANDFLSQHDNPKNYRSNPQGFDKAYAILDKYGKPDEDVDKVYDRMSDEDKMRVYNYVSGKPSMSESNKSKKVINEETTSEKWVTQYGVDILYTEGQEDVENKIEFALIKAGLDVLGIQPTDASWSVEEYERMTGYMIGESKKVKGKRVTESYRGLQNFKKQSESKAFYKTFKKMNDALKEGKALTRQESIDLYKAANSALTQMSIELEHNPKFLRAFNESSSLLSKDVNSLRESLARGKAPSKKTMKSLAKFSEALLLESNDDKAELEKMLAYEWGYVDAGSVEAESSIEMWREGPQEEKDMVINQYAEQFPSLDRATIIQCIDNIVSEYEKKGKIHEAKFGWSDKSEEEIGNILKQGRHIKHTKSSDGEDEYTVYWDDMGDKGSGYGISKDTAMKFKDYIRESDEEDFIGDDEGDVQSEEADAFDQEYADARVELHKELADKFSDDPDVQEKLQQDANDVINLPGTTEEQAAELTGGESTEEPIDDEDDSEITDDELAELKKHLAEMRATKK